MRTVSALFIDPEGPYPRMPGVDCWDERRDAFKYTGSNPVVCHPPCGPWGDMAHFSKQDKLAAIYAVAVVQRTGGVLEHPARSRLWAHMSLPAPGQRADSLGGYSLYVEQVSYGHVTRKPTWLYVVRAPIPALKTGGTPTHAIRRTKTTNSRGFRVPECSKLQRRITPQAFAELLVHIARSVEQ